MAWQSEDCGDGPAMARHVAIIMDGNGRWARDRGLARGAGHRRGVETLRRIVKDAAELGLECLTLYSFSSENWKRPADEVADLLGLLRHFIRKDLVELHENNLRVRVIGERENLPDDIARMIVEAERLTEHNDAMTVTIAFNYGSRNEIARATRRIVEDVEAGRLAAAAVDGAALEARLDTAELPQLDLLIRTGGEYRLSNFLLWQASYAELVFSPVYWPAFTRADLEAALATFATRQRRFGGLQVEATG